MKKIICLILVLILTINSFALCYANDTISYINSDSKITEQNLINFYTELENKQNDVLNKENTKMYTTIIENDSKEERKIEKVEVYDNNNNLIETYSGNEALKYLVYNPPQLINSSTKINDFTSYSSASVGWTGNVRKVYSVKPGDTRVRKVIPTSSKILISAATLSNYVFDVFLSESAPVFSFLKTIFELKQELGGIGEMGTYSVGDVIEKHDDKWSYVTYEREFISASNERLWIPNLKVEYREIGYRQEYKIWNKNNTYSFVYANYGERIETFTPILYSDLAAAKQFMNDNCNYWDRIEVYHTGKSNIINLKCETSNKKYVYLLNSPREITIH